MIEMKGEKKETRPVLTEKEEKEEQVPGLEGTERGKNDDATWGRGSCASTKHHHLDSKYSVGISILPFDSNPSTNAIGVKDTNGNYEWHWLILSKSTHSVLTRSARTLSFTLSHFLSLLRPVRTKNRRQQLHPPLSHYTFTSSFRFFVWHPFTPINNSFCPISFVRGHQLSRAARFLRSRVIPITWYISIAALRCKISKER